MKPSHALLALGIATMSYSGAIYAAPKVLLAQDQTSKIAQVKAGTLKEAHASWWGFDKNDSTKALQDAIDSGASRLIIDNTGSDWIVNKPIKLASNQEIVFADGVVIQAMKGKFKGKNDSLFVAQKKSDIKLIGRGNATLRMQRADYDNPDLYSKSEWRHGIGLWDCKNIVIRNLTVEETGGDGLYLGASSNGYNKNVLVENCNFIDNYRQGISVISAEDFIVRNTKMNTTRGTAPQAGIDYEPNTSGQRLVNCVIENSELIGNMGSGVAIYAVNLKKDSPPISITVRNSTISGNRAGFSSTITRVADDSAVGKVLLENCRIIGDTISLRNPVAGTVDYTFRGTMLDLSQKENADKTPINISWESTVADKPLGGIRFEHLVVKNKTQQPIDLRLNAKAEITDQISGSLVMEHDGKRTPFNLSSFVHDTRERLKSVPDIADALMQRTAGITRLSADQTPQIDGKLDEEIYRTTPWLSPFVKYFNLLGSVRTDVQTNAFAAYDNENLYIAVRSYEPNMAMQKVTGNKHDDSVWEGENLDIGILKPEEKTDDPKAAFYHFIINPNNISWDAINTGTTADTAAYNPTWKSATFKGANEWTTEIAIPWKELGVENARAGMQIHANISRKRDGGTLEYSSWSQFLGGFQEPQHFGTWILK